MELDTVPFGDRTEAHGALVLVLVLARVPGRASRVDRVHALGESLPGIRTGLRPTTWIWRGENPEGVLRARVRLGPTGA